MTAARRCARWPTAMAAFSSTSSRRSTACRASRRSGRPTAPKSNAAYTAFVEARAMANQTGSLMPPMHILNAPTRLMRNLGYGKGYVYDHATEEGFSGQNYFPDGVARREFYRPSERGFEREVKKRLDYWEKLRQRAAGSGTE